MNIPVWKEGMTAEQGKDIAYAERNLLALYLAKLTNEEALEGCMHILKSCDCPKTSGWYYDYENNWAGWLRVISINHGAITFHVPDDFPLGDLPQIQPNWNGHTTEEKWRRVMQECGIQLSEQKEE